MVHAKARSVLKELQLPMPLKKRAPLDNSIIDLSNNTNPYGGSWSAYSDVNQLDIKKPYLETLFKLNQRLDPTLPSNFLTSDHIQLTVGSIEGLDLVQRSFTDPEDVICIPHPSFEGFQHWGKINNLVLQAIPLQGENLETLSIDSIKKQNPKMVFICDPNNPTGTQLKPGLIPQICSEVSGLVVVDEAYIELSNRPSCIQYLKDFKNLIILRTLSKAWGMAGLRCGAVLSYDPQIIESLKYIQAPFGLSTPAQEQLKKKVGNMAALLVSREKIIKNRENFIQKIQKSKSVTKIYNSHTNFVCLVLKNFKATLKKFHQEGILVQDCSHLVPNAIRITISKRAHLNKAAQVLGA